jgi:hypothetical protein
MADTTSSHPPADSAGGLRAGAGAIERVTKQLRIMQIVICRTVECPIHLP